MKKNVTMREIGHELGVSAVTVSKALAGRSGVSENVREQIVKKAQEMGYRYDLVPKVKEAGRDIGILVADHFLGPGNSFYASLCKKLVQQLAEHNCYGILEILTEADELNCIYPGILSGGRVDGLVILGQVSRDYIQMLEKVGMRVPYVCMDFYDERANADAVVSDGMYGSYRLTSHLIHMGHTRIAFLGSIRATSSIMDRYLGYYRSMLQHDLPIDKEWLIPDRNIHGGSLNPPLPEPMPTAFVCNCDLVAYGLIQQLQEHGLRVPEDVSVVGFDDFTDSVRATPALTTFAVDQDSMARSVSELIVSKLGGAPTQGGRVVIGGQLKCRDSVRDLTKQAARS